MKTRPALKITGGLAALALGVAVTGCAATTDTSSTTSPAKTEQAAKQSTAETNANAQREAKRARALQLMARGQRLSAEIVRLSARGQKDPLSACDSVVPQMRQRLRSFSTVVDKLGGYVQYADDPAAQRQSLKQLRGHRDAMSSAFSQARQGCAQLKALGV
ncbi:MAG: hypothetical protein ACXVR1_08700 [Solirubrobacteraceae bacterium]